MASVMDSTMRNIRDHLANGNELVADMGAVTYYAYAGRRNGYVIEGVYDAGGGTTTSTYSFGDMFRLMEQFADFEQWTLA